MTENDKFSDELLNAYVDGELDSEERQRLEDAMQADDRLRERVAELKELKNLVKSAYMDEMPEGMPAVPRRTWSGMGMAASVAAFALGVVMTWGWFSYMDGTTGPRVAAVPGQEAGDAGEQDRVVKVVFHLSRDEPGQLRTILNEAEALLTTTKRTGQTASVRIIASGAGLSLFEKQSSPLTRRVMAMKREYQGHLVFNGCGVAYEELKKQRGGGDLEMLPELQLVDLGVLELMRRQREGWAYIRL